MHVPLFRESVTLEKAGLVSSPDIIWRVYHFQYKVIRAGLGFESGTVTKTGQAKVHGPPQFQILGYHLPLLPQCRVTT